MDHTAKRDFFTQAINSVVKPLIFAAGSVIIGVQAHKVITGGRLATVREFENNGIKAVVIEGDTLWKVRPPLSMKGHPTP